MAKVIIETWQDQGKVYKIAGGHVYEQHARGWITTGLHVHTIRSSGTLVNRTQVELAPPCRLGPPGAGGTHDPTRTRGLPN